MELWVRSQDKKHLMKCEAIMYEKTGTGYGLRVFTKNYDFNIAEYETKERAIEVLDEIQNILKPKMIVNTYKVEQAKLCDGTQFIQPMLDDIQVQNATTYVYEMPEK